MPRKRSRSPKHHPLHAAALERVAAKQRSLEAAQTQAVALQRAGEALARCAAFTGELGDGAVDTAFITRWTDECWHDAADAVRRCPLHERFGAGGPPQGDTALLVAATFLRLLEQGTKSTRDPEGVLASLAIALPRLPRDVQGLAAPFKTWAAWCHDTAHRVRQEAEARLRPRAEPPAARPRSRDERISLRAAATRYGVASSTLHYWVRQLPADQWPKTNNRIMLRVQVLEELLRAKGRLT